MAIEQFTGFDNRLFEGEVVNGKPNGKARSYYMDILDPKTRKVIYEVEYVDGVIEGNITRYSPISGLILAVTSYKGGVKNGEEIEMYPSLDGSRKIKSIKDYFNGEIHGKFQSFYPNGGLMEVYNFEHGVLEGTKLTFFHSGELETVTQYSKGLVDGYFMHYKMGSDGYTYLYISKTYSMGSILLLSEYTPEGKMKHYFKTKMVNKTILGIDLLTECVVVSDKRYHMEDFFDELNSVTTNSTFISTDKNFYNGCMEFLKELNIYHKYLNSL